MDVVCGGCGYKWDCQRTLGYYATCPRCMRKVKIMDTPDMVNKRKAQGRSIPPIEFPEGVKSDTYDGQIWLLAEVERLLRVTADLTPADIKILNDLKDCTKVFKDLYAAKMVSDFEKRLKGLEAASGKG